MRRRAFFTQLEFWLFGRVVKNAGRPVFSQPRSFGARATEMLALHRLVLRGVLLDHGQQHYSPTPAGEAAAEFFRWRKPSGSVGRGYLP